VTQSSVGVTRSFVLRFLIFFTALSLLPAAALLIKATLHHSTARMHLARAAWNIDRRWIMIEIARVTLASFIVPFVLTWASLLVWGPLDRGILVRIVRTLLLIGVIATFRYPGLLAMIPLVRAMPWVFAVAMLLFVLAALHARREWRATRMEVLFGLGAAFLLVATPRFPARPPEFKRPLTPNDVLLLGFDSVSYGDVADILNDYHPSNGTKVVFARASTPMPVTGPAWRSVLSGLTPPETAGVPGTQWPPLGSRWLPADVAKLGYSVRILQDNSETNVFRRDESIETVGLQGWKLVMQEYLWRHVFPLSVAGSHWWVSLLGGPADSNGQFDYCSDCFWSEALRQSAESSSHGPLLFAAHSCQQHPPIHLSISEVIRLDGWWRRPATQLEGTGMELQEAEGHGGAEVRQTRMQSVRVTMKALLHTLDRAGILGHARVVLFSDHGPRDSSVPQAVTNHVMLAVFVPSAQRFSATVTDRVSLVDIAPNIRRWLAIDRAESGLRSIDGVPSALWMTRTAELPAAVTPTLESVGLNGNDLAVLQKAIRLDHDGSFTITVPIPR
jgi:hypothetical protein